MSAETSVIKETGSILEDAKKLASRFKNSDLYKDYCRYKNKLEIEDPPLMERVRAYKKSQIDLEVKRLKEGHLINLGEEKQVAYEYTELSLHPTAGAFLALEFELLELYRKTLDVICEACEIEL